MEEDSLRKIKKSFRIDGKGSLRKMRKSFHFDVGWTVEEGWSLEAKSELAMPGPRWAAERRRREEGKI